MGKYKGGYIIVSLASLDIASSGATKEVKGIYEKLEGSYGKPILLTDIVVDGVEKHDIFVMAEVVGTNYVINGVYGKQINITQGDYVIALTNTSKHIADIITEKIVVDENLTFELSNKYVGDLLRIRTNKGDDYVAKLYVDTTGESPESKMDILNLKTGVKGDSTAVFSAFNLNEPESNASALSFDDSEVTEIEVTYEKYIGYAITY